MLVDNGGNVLRVCDDILVILLFQNKIFRLDTVYCPPGNRNHRVASHEREDEHQRSHENCSLCPCHLNRLLSEFLGSIRYNCFKIANKSLPQTDKPGP